MARNSLVAQLTPDYGTDTIVFPPVITYALVAGAGSDDNDTFTISGDRLTINVSPDHERKASYTIRIRISNGLRTLAGAEVIRIIDVPEAATGLALSHARVDENVPLDTVIGEFSAVDEDSDAFIYTLVRGTGSQDNGVFAIFGNELQIRGPPDYESRQRFYLRVGVRDAAAAPGEQEYQRAFVVEVNNIVLPLGVVFAGVYDSCNDGKDVEFQLHGFNRASGREDAVLTVSGGRSTYSSSPFASVQHLEVQCTADDDMDEQYDEGLIDTVCYSASSDVYYDYDDSIGCKWFGICDDPKQREWGGSHTGADCIPCPAGERLDHTWGVLCQG